MVHFVCLTHGKQINGVKVCLEMIVLLLQLLMSKVFADTYIVDNDK